MSKSSMLRMGLTLGSDDRIRPLIVRRARRVGKRRGTRRAHAAGRYVAKPWQPEDLRLALRRAIELYALDRERDQLVRELSTLNRVARFLGIAEAQVGMIPPDNARPFVEPGVRAAVLGRVIRAGATAGTYFPPDLWRRASKPLVSLLQSGGPTQRPKLAPEQRRALLGDCLDDIALLEHTLGESFEDWRSAAGRGSFAERTASGQS